MRRPPRWVIAVSLAVAGTLPGDALLYAVLPIVWTDLGLELWMVGVLLSANRFVRLLTNPLAGWIVDRTGVRLPFLLAVFASVLTTAAYGVLTGFAALLAARLLWGLCWSFLRLGGFLAALGAASRQDRGFHLGFYSGVANVGTVLAVLTGGWLTDAIGFRSTMLVYASLAGVAGLAMLRERPPAAETRLEREESSIVETGGTPGRAPRFAVYLASFVAGAAGSGLVLATLGLHLVELFGDEISIGGVVLGVATLNGFALSSRFAANVVWAPAAGHLSDRTGRLPFLAISGSVTAAAVAGLAITTAPGTTLLLALGVFLGGTALRVALDAAAGDLTSPETRSRTMSQYATASDLGMAVGPLLAYLLAGTLGVAGVYAAGSIFLALAGGAALGWLRAVKPRPSFTDA